MEKDNASGTKSLENELRSMILSNVTISNGQLAQDTSTHGHQHRRGRGGSYRGRNSNTRSFQTRSDYGDTSKPGPPVSPAVRGSRDSPRAYRGFNNRPQTNAYHQAPRQRAAQGEWNVPNIQHNPTQNRQNPEHRQPSRAGYHSSPTPGHKILQRPHDHSATPGRPPPGPTTHYSPWFQGSHMSQQQMEHSVAQTEYLDRLAAHEIPKVHMTYSELEEKEAFRVHLESICQKAFLDSYSEDTATISLVGFGSLASGFGMPGSDMDLAIVLQWKDSSQADNPELSREIPRLFERAILDSKMGGRLLTRTRVPILKVCQHPTEALYTALFDERKRWDELPEEEKYPAQVPQPEPSPLPKPSSEGEAQKSPNPTIQSDKSSLLDGEGPKKANPPLASPTKQDDGSTGNPKERADRVEKPWLREKVLGPLDFPKEGVGIQCDINFENPLGLHNTHLLRCYSLTDTRVRSLVLFVKSWAKRRKINSSYSGTLSSYGWVLMVLHYLVNVAQPPVCPNLQLAWRPPTDVSGLEQMFQDTVVSGYSVRFWRNENEILHAASSGQLSRNQETIGALLRGFFQYYASVNSGYTYGQRPPSFYWTTEVLSLRTPGGIRTKQDKGWVSAKTTYTAEKKITNRYLFAIEDPFELDHNVARTVTHRGIVAIRDEFRRAWRILSAVGRKTEPEGGIFDQIVEQIPPVTPNTPNTFQEAATKRAKETEETVADVGDTTETKTETTADTAASLSKTADCPPDKKDD